MAKSQSELEILLSTTGVDEASSKFSSFQMVGIGVGAALASSFALVTHEIWTMMGGIESIENALIIGTGASGSGLASMSNIAEDLAFSIAGAGYEFSEVGSIVADVNTRFAETGDELEGLSEQFMHLSRMTGEDYGASIRRSAQLMHSFNMTTEETSQYLDKLFVLSQATGVGFNELQGYLVTYDETLRSMGLGADESAAFLANLEKQGLNVGRVMMSLQQAESEAASEGYTLADALPVVTNAIANAGDETEAVNMAAEFFGSRAGPMLARAIREGSLEWQELLPVMESSENAIVRTGEETITLGERFGTIRGQFTEAFKPIAEDLIELAEEYMPGIETSINNLSAVIEDNLPNWITQFSEWAGYLKTAAEWYGVLVGLTPGSGMREESIAYIQEHLGFTPSVYPDGGSGIRDAWSGAVDRVTAENSPYWWLNPYSGNVQQKQTPEFGYDVTTAQPQPQMGPPVFKITIMGNASTDDVETGVNRALRASGSVPY